MSRPKLKSFLRSQMQKRHQRALADLMQTEKEGKTNKSNNETQKNRKQFSQPDFLKPTGSRNHRWAKASLGTRFSVSPLSKVGRPGWPANCSLYLGQEVLCWESLETEGTSEDPTWAYARMRTDFGFHGSKFIPCFLFFPLNGSHSHSSRRSLLFTACHREP